jgi:hypothetical protein
MKKLEKVNVIYNYYFYNFLEIIYKKIKER